MLFVPSHLMDSFLVFFSFLSLIQVEKSVKNTGFIIRKHRFKFLFYLQVNLDKCLNLVQLSYRDTIKKLINFLLGIFSLNIHCKNFF